jgi:hypothetical protein
MLMQIDTCSRTDQRKDNSVINIHQYCFEYNILVKVGSTFFSCPFIFKKHIHRKFPKDLCRPNILMLSKASESMLIMSLHIAIILVYDWCTVLDVRKNNLLHHGLDMALTNAIYILDPVNLHIIFAYICKLSPFCTWLCIFIEAMIWMKNVIDVWNVACDDWKTYVITRHQRACAPIQ